MVLTILVPVRSKLSAAATVFVASALVLLALSGDARADYTVSSCGQYYNEGVFSPTVPAGKTSFLAVGACPASGIFANPDNPVGYDLWANTAPAPIKSVPHGHRAAWQATAPAGLEITAASTSGMLVTNVNATGSTFGGGAYWSGGGATIGTHTVKASASWGPFASPYFGFQIVCGGSPCPASDKPEMLISAVSLRVHEMGSPALSSPSGLWQAKGWIRGSWPFDFSADSPSGVCQMTVSLNGAQIGESDSKEHDPATWHQCAAPPITGTVNTAAFAEKGWPMGEGAMPLAVSGKDEADTSLDFTTTIHVDNSTPMLSLSGATDAPSTAGTQFVTATAGGSPSGIDGISCSVDGGPAHWYAGARASVPVSGLGEHTVSCNALNNSVTPAGVHGESATRTWSIKIGAPTELGVAFEKYVGLRCRRVRVRKTIPGHWVKRHWHHRLVKMKTRPRHKTVRVTKCHPKTKRERVRVRVPVRRHGELIRHHGKVVYRTKVEHKTVVMQPHWKAKTKERIKYGKSTTVSGWLGMTDGTALGGQTVTVLTAPDDGLDQFTPAATVMTTANGSWAASLPAGPSRLVQASYGGTSTTEAAGSGQVTLLVPAKVKLDAVTPRRVAWGHAVKIKGELDGGHLPPGGVNVRLRIGIANAKTTYGVHEHVSGDGHFTTTYTFGAGAARIHRRYWFQIASLPSSDYPYTPSHSGRVYVRVGGHPRHHCRRSAKSCT